MSEKIIPNKSYDPNTCDNWKTYYGEIVEEGGYFRLNRYLLEKLGPIQSCILTYLIESNLKPKYFPTGYGNIARSVGLSKGTVFKRISQLVALGYVKVEPGEFGKKEQHPNAYVVNMPKIWALIASDKLTMEQAQAQAELADSRRDLPIDQKAPEIVPGGGGCLLSSSADWAIKTLLQMKSDDPESFKLFVDDMIVRASSNIVCRNGLTQKQSAIKAVKEGNIAAFVANDNDISNQLSEFVTRRPRHNRDPLLPDGVDF